MKTLRTIPLAIPLAILLASPLAMVVACGDSTGGTGDDTTGGTSAGTDATTGGTSTDPTVTTSPATTTPADTTEGPQDNCPEYQRYPLHEGLSCSRLTIGDVDGDGFVDAVVFAHDPKTSASPTTTVLHTFHGDANGLQDAEVRCCLDATRTGHGEVFDLNGDTRGDLLWANEHAIEPGGDVLQTLERTITTPERGYTATGVLVAPPTGVPAFTVGRIMGQTFGVLVVADGVLSSNVGTGAAFGLDPVLSLELDPSPEVTQLLTIEIDGTAGTDLVGLGPEGLWVWPGSPDGVFGQATVVALPGTYTQMQKVDLDLDNHDSLVLAGAGQPVAIVDGDEAGAYLVSTTGTPDLDPPIAVVQIDNDLQPDLAGASGNDFVMHAGDGKAFGAQVVLGELSAIHDMGFGDFDGNGRDDVVACDDEGLFVIYRADD